MENDLVENKGGLRNAAQVWTEGECGIGACDKGEHVRCLSVWWEGLRGERENSTLPMNTENYLYFLAVRNTYKTIMD